ncbi:MAG: cysteinyl-tRNA synthetase, partial [Patescibacteria group bacterium]|nr:cysteinyl-tRNA synthetase [Patescibacteria group bacterium]
DFIEEQITLVTVLEQKGYTYVIDDGVYFDTSKFSRYADFAHLDLDAIKKGARVEYNVQKLNPSDFALWKFSPKDEKRDMQWQSPWGVGFPGWHLECSAMALAKLGPTIDIHAGGIDHIAVHHTNEIAQSECANDAPFANYWLHNNHMLSNGTKISKSLNNGYTLNDIYNKGYSANDFRMLLLQSHYRTESNFSWDNLQSAKNRLANWANIACLRWQITVSNLDYNGQYINAITKITNALSNDLDTPTALVEAEKSLNYAEVNGVTEQTVNDFTKFLEHIQSSLGLEVLSKDINNDQKQILAKRKNARDNNDWQESDNLRNLLLEQGIEVKDTKIGQIWYRAN